MFCVTKGWVLSKDLEVWDRRRIAMSDERYRRVNILIREEQYQSVSEQGLSLSGLVRDLLDDRLSETTITLTLSRSTKRLYDTVISNFGASDGDLEKYFLQALDSLLQERARELEKLRDAIVKSEFAKETEGGS